MNKLLFYTMMNNITNNIKKDKSFNVQLYLSFLLRVVHREMKNKDCLNVVVVGDWMQI